MADGPSVEDAATDLGNSDSRLTRERHKRQDAPSSMTSLSTGQDIARRIHDDASVLENHPHHRQHQHQQLRALRRNCHTHPHILRRLSGNGNNNNNNNNNGNVNNNHHHHHHFRRREHEDDDVAVDGIERLSKIESDSIAGVDTTRILPFASPSIDDYDEDDDDDEEDEEDDEEDDEEEYEDAEVMRKENGVSKKCYGGVRIDVTKTVKNEESCSGNSNSSSNGISNNISNNNNNNNENSGGEGVAMIVHATRVENTAFSADGRRSRSSSVAFLDTDAPNDRVSKVNECRVNDNANDEYEYENGNGNAVQKVNRLGCDNSERDEVTRKTDDISSDGSSDGGSSNSSSSSSNSSGGAAAAAAAVSASGGGGAGAAGVTANGLVAGRHQGSPFKGQVRMAEDTLVGPCGKKRCADRYDSSESSDSGVAVSCGECSSSGTSDITEPGSPCSTSSDEGVAIRGASASPLPSLPKLAPSSQISTRPQWPWTPPLAATACSTYKRHKGEPEAGALPRSGAADPTFRGTIKSNGKPNAAHHHHETQGKITEYFKTQIKPQQPKTKKNSEAMSVLVAKSSSEFRRPPTVQRNKGGLAKYLGTVLPNSRNVSTNDWEVRGLTMSPPPTKKPPPMIVPRTNGKMDKKLPKPVPSLPISNDVLKNIPSCKISSLRLTSDASSNVKSSSPPSTPAPLLTSESTTAVVGPVDFKGCILSKPHVNENNNLTNGCGTILASLRSQGNQEHPLSRLAVPENTESKEAQVSPADEEDAEEEEEDSSRSSESKPSLSPILSAPTTIRFPAREPGKDRQQGTDSGVCRWDKCEESFESSSGLLEHLQAAHINTQTGGDNFVCQWQGCKVQGRSSCSRRWLERHVLSHGGNKPFRCIVDGCGSRFSSQTALERHVNGHFNQVETSNNSGRRSCESGGKLVRRNGKRLRYRRQPWSARLFDYFDSGVMEGLQHRLLQLAKSRTQGRLAETPGNSMALTSQVLARRVEMDGKTKVLLRWYPPDIEPDEWVLESEVQNTKNVGIREVASAHPEEVTLALYSAISSGPPPLTRVKQRRKPVKNS
ncbi:probable serine/threonine-protein kinase DDB_G0282963 [Osmia bicornis bicornis]|uniref:probable serine/threonine-protein kinase DDB_G0282963 n=1 Tax=Osmia bicornis bicornis TaxID=1437191 RepID=UPI001EAEF96A|nr:probable serine/threonine-protein kinase DDB_G0282963 [Osmia bicornis bicornis]